MKRRSPKQPGLTASTGGNRQAHTQVRNDKLIPEVQCEPYAGLDKPEPLKHALAGYWSRRINDEHSIVCRVQDDVLWIAQLRYHH